MVEKNKIKISGIAVREGTSLNKRKYISKELHSFAPSLIGKPILKDHIAETDGVIGKITAAKSIEDGKIVSYEGWIKDDKSGILEKIKDGRISEVSIGAVADTVVKESEDSEIVIPKGLKALELSTTPTPGNDGTSLNLDYSEKLNVDLSESIVKSMIESYNSENKIVEDKSTEHPKQDEIMHDEELEECPECKKMIPKKEMESHMEKEHLEKMKKEKMMSEDEVRKQMKQEHPDWSDKDIENEIEKMRKMKPTGKLKMPEKKEIIKLQLTKSQKFTKENRNIINKTIQNIIFKRKNL